MNVIQIQPCQLGIADAASIQQFKNRFIPRRPARRIFVHAESTTRFICSIDGTRGKCFGNRGVATSEATFCSTCPVRASHLNQLRIAASARAAEAFESPRSSKTSKIGANMQMFDAIDRLQRRVPLGNVRSKSHQLAPICPQRMLRRSALVLEHAQILIHQSRERVSAQSAPSSPAPSSGSIILVLRRASRRHPPVPRCAFSPCHPEDLERSPTLCLFRCHLFLRFHLPPRMMLPMHRLQPPQCQMRIHLRRRNVRVPQQHLHAAQIRAMFHHVRCAAVPQPVRARVFVSHLHQVPDPLPRQGHPAQRKKQPRRILPRWRSIFRLVLMRARCGLPSRR